MSQMKTHQIRNSLLLLMAAVIWGVAFVAQSVAVDYIETFTLNGIRFVMGGMVMLPVIIIRDRKEKAGENRIQQDQMRQNEAQEKEARRAVLIGGTASGITLFVATTLQQWGIIGTTAGKAGFLTALYIIIVPIIGIFFGKKQGIRLWISVVLALTGMYLLCMQKESLTINRYDMFLLICAVAFAIQILLLDHYTQWADPLKLACMEFFVCGGLSLAGMILTEHPRWENIVAAAVPLLYTGILSSGVAYSLQAVCQKNLNPVVASLIMSLESVISAIAGWLILGQKLSSRELLGCVIMFSAIILAQLPDKKDLIRQDRKEVID